jgi:hypothetical protein
MPVLGFDPDDQPALQLNDLLELLMIRSSLMLTFSLASALILSSASAVQATPVSYQQNYSFPLSPGNQILNLPQWDPASFPGQTLISVELYIDSLVQADVTGENDSAIGGNMSANLVGIVSASGLGLSPSASIIAASGPFAVAPTDGNPGSGPDFINFGTVSGSDTDTDGPIFAGLGPFIGAGTFAVTVSGNGGFSLSGVSDSTLEVSNFGTSGEVIVTYNYVPEPGSIVLASLGAVGLALAAWKKRRR